MIAVELWYPGGRTLEDDLRATSEHLSSSSLHNFLASRASFLLENFGQKRTRTSDRASPGQVCREILVLVDVMHPSERCSGHGILDQLGHFKNSCLTNNKLVQPDLILPAPIAELLQHFHFQFVPEG